jgi:hypothetical protein
MLPENTEGLDPSPTFGLENCDVFTALVLTLPLA